MYNHLWDEAIEHTDEKRSQAILAAAHRLLASEGGEPEIVIAAAILATVPKDIREKLLKTHVNPELHGEIHGILDSDPENTNARVTHDAILLAEYTKYVFRGTEENFRELEESIQFFKTESGKRDAKHYLSDRNNDIHGIIPKGAKSLNESSAETIKDKENSQTAMKSAEKEKIESETNTEAGKLYHWADQTALRIIAEKGNKGTYTIAAGITPSGVVHIGNFREIITNDLIVKALERLGKKVRFIYSWDDYDTFRKVPKNIPESYKKYLFQPTVDVPDPFDCKHENYADHFKAEITEDLPIVGIFPEFLHQSKKYRACEYAEDIKHALNHREEIRNILNEFKTEEISENWWPLSVYCEQCNRDRTVTVTAFDGQYGVTYTCQCGYTNTFDIRKKGISKLPWRVDWPMRWHKEKVDFEPGGKDHSSQGGSFDSGKVISKKIWDYDAPTYIMYDFISIKGEGGKMSSSSGNTATLREVLKIYTPELVRFLFAGTRPGAEFAISFDIDVFKVYEDFDTVERLYYGVDEAANSKERENARRVYELSVIAPAHHCPVQPSFRHLTNYVQIAEGNMDKVVEMLRHEIRTPIDEARIRNRGHAAWNWIKNYAPEQYRFQLSDKPYKTDIDEATRNALKKLGGILADQNEEELMETFYQICNEFGIQNTAFFKAAYQTLIGKDRGPKLAHLITQAGHERIQKVLNQL